MRDGNKRDSSDDEELPCVTLEGQFVEFAKLLDTERSGETITLYNSDYWMRQSRIIDDRRLTMTDTGVTWSKFQKTELNWDEWKEYIAELCDLKGLDQVLLKEMMTNCGLPGVLTVRVPQYRDFFLTYRSKKALINCPSISS